MISTLQFILTLIIQAACWNEYANITSVLGYLGLCTIELSYSNPESLTEYGSYCDFMLHNRKCDVYFNICINATEETCDVFSHTTSVFRNQNDVIIEGSDAIQVFVRSPIPPYLDVLITINDWDDETSSDPIGRFKGKDVPLKITDYFVSIPLTQLDRRSPSIKLQFKMRFQCMQDYFGTNCSKYCKSDDYSYVCSPDGTMICNEGFFGDSCNQTKNCHKEPCALNAKCVDKFFGRQCICNGGDLPECYPSDDPCSRQPCLNGGLCNKDTVAPDGRGFTCKCPKLWYGYLCERRISLCQLAQDEENALAEVLFLRRQTMAMKKREVCLNGGECVDHYTKPAFFCKCPLGWDGLRCERAVVKTKNHHVILSSTLVSIFLFILVIGIVIYFCKRRNWKKRVENLQNRPKFIYEPLQHPTTSIIYKPIVTDNGPTWVRKGEDADNDETYEKIRPGLDVGSMHYSKSSNKGIEEQRNEDIYKPALPKREQNIR